MSSSNNHSHVSPIDPSTPQQSHQQSARSANQHHLIAAATSALASSSTTPPIMANLTTASTSQSVFSTTSSGPSFPALSAATEEILKRVVGSQNAAAAYSANPNTAPGWEAAKQQVLQSMVTTSNMPPPTPIPSARRRGRPSAAAAAGTPTGASTTPTTGPRGGRGGARGGGAARGRKRKRSSMKRESPSPSPTPSSSSHNSAHSSRSSSPTASNRPALPATTKSGRAIHKPSHFDPTISITPARAPRRRRGPYRRMHEASVCRCCGRGESPKGNQIVFCDGCNAPWHQMCHEPRIELKEGKEGEDEGWWCANCAPGVGKASAGSAETEQEKRTYLMGLPIQKLVELLLLAEGLHPGLPIYPPNLMTVSTPTTSTTAPAISAPLVSPTTGMFHPKPGHGLRMPPENEEDVAWLEDDDFVAFSHIYRDLPSEGGDVEMGGTDASATGAAAAAATGGMGEVIGVGA